MRPPPQGALAPELWEALAAEEREARAALVAAAAEARWTAPAWAAALAAQEEAEDTRGECPRCIFSHPLMYYLLCT